MDVFIISLFRAYGLVSYHSSISYTWYMVSFRIWLRFVNGVVLYTAGTAGHPNLRYATGHNYQLSQILRDLKAGFAAGYIPHHA